jgi:hypothetical protein
MAITVQFQRNPLPPLSSFQRQNSGLFIFLIHCQSTCFRNWIRWSVPILALWCGETPTKLDTTDRTIPNQSEAASTTISSENRNRCSPYNIVLISQNQIKGKVHKLNNSQHNMSLAKPFNKCDMLFYCHHLWCTPSPPHTLWCNNSTNFIHGGWIMNTGVNISCYSIIRKVT